MDQIVMAIVPMPVGEYGQTMGRQAATVVFPEVIASVIAIAIAIWWETAVAEELEMMRRVHWQGPRWKGARSASSSERRRTCS